MVIEFLALDRRNEIRIDTLSLSEFVAITFATFAYGNKVIEQGVNRLILDPSVFLREFPAAQQLLERFLQGRALSTADFAAKP